MYKQTPLQDIYNIMQMIMIQMRCFSSSTMNVEHKEELKQMIFRAGKYTQQYHSAVCSCGNLLTELSVWRSLELYCLGYSYRLVSNATAKRILYAKLSDLTKKLIQLTTQLNASYRAHRIAESYLDLLIEIRYRVQAQT